MKKVIILFLSCFILFSCGSEGEKKMKVLLNTTNFGSAIQVEENILINNQENAMNTGVSNKINEDFLYTYLHIDIAEVKVQVYVNDINTNFPQFSPVAVSWPLFENMFLKNNEIRVEKKEILGNPDIILSFMTDKSNPENKYEFYNFRSGEKKAVDNEDFSLSVREDDSNIYINVEMKKGHISSFIKDGEIIIESDKEKLWQEYKKIWAYLDKKDENKIKEFFKYKDIEMGYGIKKPSEYIIRDINDSDRYLLPLDEEYEFQIQAGGKLAIITRNKNSTKSDKQIVFVNNDDGSKRKYNLMFIKKDGEFILIK